ncbi:hypothetical protein ASPACDRAFT_62727 [Aspergillus aculeatus ATCC 16872]|uniref:Uncharacterized protein n=1 Tax=Aspergillus aculeatus (strain ATCC 16872 / CBS 172.66 / WB 5094) TaxID=690307 RepID=A0A1L9WNP2_ASPA1|nr:uncharacterized protein ASPACDRAFT_62727 [Aspergillus aculeatus ATCC 16872]OJJ97761.1 hypothetical protein ASPACDRAFT_62727 [Aspergillus aculeatus ATCC 16872]
MTIHQATTPADSSGNSTKDKGPYHPILQAYVADNNLSSPEAATTIASTTLSPPASGESLEDKLTHLWRLILDLAIQNPAHQDKLVSLLTALSHLPDATAPRADEDEDAKSPLTVHDMRVWQDLPMLGWEIRHRWNDSVPAPSSTPGTKETEERAAAIARIVNVNRFVARLVATHEPVFRPHAWFALVTLRRALETPWERMSPEDPLAAWVPAAAVWVEVLGAEIYGWEEEYAAGPGVGARGRGGPLWKGKHGFCRERWGLWRERFGEVAGMEGEDEGVRSVAREAERRMKGIEAGVGGVDR